MAKKLTAGNLLGFPSSYGISFILILLATVGCYSLKLQAFPSPYGVLFILIFFFKISIDLETIPVSVSLWSIIHSYFKLVKNGAFGG